MKKYAIRCNVSKPNEVEMKNVNLTEGKPIKVVWRFCLPLFGSILFQQLYNIADSFVAGRFISENALASVSNSYEVTLIFLAISTGINIGCSVVVAHYFGANEYDRLKTAIYTTFIMAAVVCFITMLLGLIFTPSLLRLINTPPEIMGDSKLYLDIYIWGVPFLMLYNISSGIFNALGDSKTTFIFLASSSTANIFMDIFFVVSLKMGVAGVAWATFICQGISAILSLIAILVRLKRIKSNEKTVVFSFSMLRNILSVAIPSMLQQSFISIGNIAVQSVVNSFGPVVMAGYGAAIKVHNTLMNGMKTFSDGITSFSAQNLGAGKKERIAEGWKCGLFLTLCIAVPITLIVVFFPNVILGIFLKKGDSMTVGRTFLRIVAPFYCLISIKWNSDGVLRGTQHMKSFMTATFTDLLLRVALAFILSVPFESTGIWLSWPLGWVIGAVVSFSLMLRVFRTMGVKLSFKKRDAEQ